MSRIRKRLLRRLAFEASRGRPGAIDVLQDALLEELPIAYTTALNIAARWANAGGYSYEVLFHPGALVQVSTDDVGQDLFFIYALPQGHWHGRERARPGPVVWSEFRDLVVVMRVDPIAPRRTQRRQ